MRFVFVLLSSKDGQLLAVLDADYLGQFRTGAVSALATRLLSREKSENLGILGSGVQARTQLEGSCTVRDVKKVRVFSPNPQHRRSFAEYASRALGLDARPVGSPEEAVRGSDLVTTVSSSRVPVSKGKWLEEGTHVNAVGSTLPDRRELDDSVIARSSLTVADSREQARNESGVLVIPIKKGLTSSRRVFELWEILAGKSRRRNEEEMTLFKSVGTALQDLAVTAKAYELAVQYRLGQDLGYFLASRPAAAR